MELTQNHDRVGQELGYPRCCREFYQKVVINESIADPTWQIACSSVDKGEYRNVEVNSLSGRQHTLASGGYSSNLSFAMPI